MLRTESHTLPLFLLLLAPTRTEMLTLRITLTLPSMPIVVLPFLMLRWELLTLSTLF